MPYRKFPSPIQCFIYFLLLFAFGNIYAPEAIAQCPSPINSFPYYEDFEADQGGWTSDGTSNDWAWGTPNKPTINSAASGNNCWVTGGLAGSFYNYGERSFVESPCFDFTALSHPIIFFKIWWESEQRFDGATLQYSLNDGAIWTNLGSVSDPVDCLNENWFNTNFISHLSGLSTQLDGWSGNIQSTAGSCLGGNGSNGWVTARHCMPQLANKTNVRFRFAFGAGTTCNDFDGIAFDDIHIENAPPITANFDISCISADSISFSSITTNCPNVWNWDFGDPGSGALNISTEENPVHTFSQPGIYTVTLNASNGCSPSASATQVVKIIGLDISESPALCFGDTTGSATVEVLPIGGNPAFAWSHASSQNTATASNLPAGFYTVSVTDPGACPATASINITQPEPLSHTTVIQPAYCGNPTGSATVQVSGGTGPYNFIWTPNGGNSATANNLPVGNYTVSITDQNNCRDTAHIQIDSTSIQAMIDVLSQVSCFGENDGAISVVVLAGTAPFNYNWTANPGNLSTITNLNSGTYTVTITDVNQCTTTASATVDQPEKLNGLFSIKNVSCNSGDDGAISVDTAWGGTPPYIFALNGSGFSGQTVFENLSAGNYVPLIQDANGCEFTNTLALIEPGPIQIFVGTDTTIFQGDFVLLQGAVSDIGKLQQIMWEPSEYLECDTCLTTLAFPPTSTIFTFITTDTSGCMEQSSVTIEVKPAPIYIPNVFAPESIQGNERFTIFAGSSVQNVELMQVYDRWGGLLFEKKNFPPSVYAEGWDGIALGKTASPGLYIYVISIRLIDGSTKTFSGDLLLIR